MVLVVLWMQALIAPASLIAQNAGVEGEVIVGKVRSTEWEFGYNAMPDLRELAGSRSDRPSQGDKVCIADRSLCCWDGAHHASHRGRQTQAEGIPCTSWFCF